MDDSMTSMNVSLPESLRRFAEGRASHGFGSVSEYIRALLREDQRRAERERLEGLLLEGLDSGPAAPFGDEFFESLRQRIRDARPDDDRGK